MFATLVLAATAAVGGGDKNALDLGAVKWWNSTPITLSRLKGRAVFVESFRTW